MISFDSLSLNIWIEENENFLKGARIQKIQQPTRRDFVLSVRKGGETKKLYISINPQWYHVCFMNKENEAKRLIEIPQKPPMFCMLLRKYLENSVISKINQPAYERILELYFETYNELSERIYLCLAVELMGKHSNVILYNYDTNIILGCAHNIGAEKSKERELAGTLPYTYPPNPPQKWYIAENSFSNNKSKSINIEIDNYYAQLIYDEKFNSQKALYRQNIVKKLRKDQNSYEKMLQKLEKENDSNKYRHVADLIMANLYDNKDYISSINVFDYEKNENITIDLDSTKTLKENANYFYKLYTKGRNSVQKLTELTENLKIEIDYYENMLYSLDIAKNIDELNEIELTEKDVKKEKTLTGPMELEIDGYKVYVGRNNRQNDFIVSKLSKDDDYWFHTKDCAGSHVLLRCENPSDNLILKCAQLAKQYSKASKSSKVGVIYTRRKYLKKPPKANLGYVTYKNEREIIV